MIYAETITSSWSSALQKIGLPGKDKVLLVVGGMVGLWDIMLQEWLNRLYQQRQDVIVQAQIHGPDILVNRVLHGAIDLAFIYDAPIHELIQADTVLDIPLVMVSTSAGLSAEEAVAGSYIMVDWGAQFLHSHNQAFPDTAAPLLYTSHDRIALNFLFQHGGSAYLAEPLVQEFLDSGTLHRLDAPVFTRSAYAIYRTDNENVELIGKLVPKAAEYPQ
jgi:hypothetical protein